MQMLRAAALAAILVMAAPVGAALADQTGVMWPAEEEQREALRTKLAQLPPDKNAIVAGLLNTALPGVGTLYGFGSGTGALASLGLVAGLDAASLGVAYVAAPASALQYGLTGIAGVHLAVGLLTAGYVAQANGDSEKDQKVLGEKLAALDAVEAHRNQTVLDTISRAEDRVKAKDFARAYADVSSIPMPLSGHPEVSKFLHTWRAEANLQLEERTAAVPKPQVAVPVAHGSDDIGAADKWAAKGDYLKALGILDHIKRTDANEHQVYNAQSRYELKAEAQFDRELFACIARAGDAGFGNFQAGYSKSLGYPYPGAAAPRVDQWLRELSRRQTMLAASGQAKNGEILFIGGDVAAVFPRGVLLSYGNHYLFVRTRSNSGLVDKDHAYFTVTPAGTESVTTIFGGRLTVHAVAARNFVHKGY